MDLLSSGASGAKEDYTPRINEADACSFTQVLDNLRVTHSSLFNPLSGNSDILGRSLHLSSLTPIV
ncbi:hypothetical protein EYF80_050022 [Liparis tanakae]|uniref:Uncharacterized protein n=1 Tax=Liparis tanakae TaxID=230148 RepID=A0A4Z2FF05_9TELE|nr:hypothetical protein EYF80_050022 [Liparis tanakae]